MRDTSDSGMARKAMMISQAASAKTSMFVADRRWLFFTNATHRIIFPKRAAMLIKKRNPVSATAKATVRLAKVIGKCSPLILVSIVLKGVDPTVNIRKILLCFRVIQHKKCLQDPTCWSD